MVCMFVLAEILNTLCSDIDQEVQNSCSKTRPCPAKGKLSKLIEILQSVLKSQYLTANYLV